MIDNFREQLNKLNEPQLKGKMLSDNEFERLKIDLFKNNTVYKAASNKQIEFFNDLTTGDEIKLQTFMEKLEDGYVFTSAGIKNLLEGDFYSWYSDGKQLNNRIY
ncbi:MAG: hypothetical protein JJE03_06920 [Peptostreptococcaceae bacterium]|nr:hypothetical protein [Peptostreptococcaceae bacterium]